MSWLARVSIEEAGRTQAMGLDEATLTGAQKIVDSVRKEGEVAIRRWSKTLGDGEGPFWIPKTALHDALARVPRETQEVLHATASRISEFAACQRASILDISRAIPGGHCGLRYQPVQRAGCYAPGGRFPLPSSVLMTACTARAAGVAEVWVASPRPQLITLAAAAVADADGLLAVGGAQGIAALAYGYEGFDACDIVVGPGNRWVTAAKRLVSGDVAIDMLAGPSELLVIADETADPTRVAADLLAQAEHDPDAVPTLVALGEGVIQSVERALTEQLSTLSTADIAMAALRNGWVTRASREQAVLLANRIAPEHLSLQIDGAASFATGLSQYGALFIGSGAAEVLGDYGAGPNHTLPTGGSARSFGALSVMDFLRAQTWLCIEDEQASQPLVRDTIRMARLEGLEGHARSAESRIRRP